MPILTTEVALKIELKVKSVDAIGTGMARVELDGALWNWMSFTVPISQVKDFPLTGKVTVEVMENADTPLGLTCCGEGTSQACYSSPLCSHQGQQRGNSSEDHQ